MPGSRLASSRSSLRCTFCDEVKGKAVEDVAKMTSADLLNLIGIEISPARLKCALLSLDTLEHALAEVDGVLAGAGANPAPVTATADGA